MTLLVTVETSDMIQVISSSTGSAGNVEVLTLVVRVEPELFQARSCSLCHCANNSSRVECESSADRVEYLLEDAPTRSSLCHRVPRYQASPNTLNRNYEVRVTSPTPLHHSGGQVEAVVYHQRTEPTALSKPCISSSHHDDFDWGLIYRWLLMPHGYQGITRNMNARSVGACLKDLE